MGHRLHRATRPLPMSAFGLHLMRVRTDRRTSRTLSLCARALSRRFFQPAAPVCSVFSPLARVLSLRVSPALSVWTVDGNGHRLYRVNGQPILLRGGGYAPSLFLESESPTTPQGLALQSVWMNLTRDLGINTIRFEGKHPADSFYDMADAVGMLMIPGWCCCDSWQHWKFWGPEQHWVAQESTRSQALRLRSHASALAFWFSSDELPPDEVEREYRAVFNETLWPNPLLASASALVSNVSGTTGVKMSGPYEYVTPNYWLDSGNTLGGAFGLLTEGGPGEALLTPESFERVIDPAANWPVNSLWDFHCGGSHGVFGTLRRYTPALNARFGAPSNAIDYLTRSQAAVYESHRAMFEGYARNKYTSTGVVQWMLNSAVRRLSHALSARCRVLRAFPLICSLSVRSVPCAVAVQYLAPVRWVRQCRRLVLWQSKGQ
jgi:hypothetical protein